MTEMGALPTAKHTQAEKHIALKTFENETDQIKKQTYQPITTPRYECWN